MPEPIMDEQLVAEDMIGIADIRSWRIRMLRSLAEQLGFANDFYFPILGVVQELEQP